MRCTAQSISDIFLSNQHPYSSSALPAQAKHTWSRVLPDLQNGITLRFAYRMSTRCTKAKARSALPSTFLTSMADDSCRLIAACFKKARETAPCLLFMDEVDAFFATRRDDNNSNVQTLTAFRREISLIQDRGDKVIIIAATNRPQALDAAHLRRFNKCIYVPLPDKNAVLKLSKTLLRDIPTEEETIKQPLDIEVGKLFSGKSRRFVSGADVRRAINCLTDVLWKEVKQATHFKRVRLSSSSPLCLLTSCQDPDRWW